MALDNFRTIELIWDKANKSIIKTIKTASSDTTGRYLSVKVLDGGQEVTLNNAKLQLYWEHPNFNTSGTDDFNTINNGGLFKMTFSDEMLTNIGELNAHLVLTLTDGRITSDGFPIEVFKGTDNGVVVPTNGSGLVEQVARKIDKGNVTLGDLTQEVKLAMTGGAVAVVGENAVGTENIKDSSVTTEKLSFPAVSGVPSKNLYNKDTALLNKTVTASGVVADLAGYFISDFIKAKPLTSYALNVSAQGLNVYFFDSQKSLISYVSNVTVFKTPEATNYVRFRSLMDNVDTAQLEEGDHSTDYQAYGNYIDAKTISDGSISSDKIAGDISLEKISEVRFGKNKFNKNTVAQGQWITSGGGIRYDETRSLSEYISIKPSTYYTLSKMQHMAIFDENFTYLTGYTINDPSTFQTPETAKYTRIGMLNTDLDTFQLEEGQNKTEYEPFGYVIDSLLVNVNNENEKPKPFLRFRDAAEAWYAGEKFPVAFFGDSQTDGNGTTGFRGHNNVDILDGDGTPGNVDYVAPNAYPKKLEEFIQKETNNPTARIYNAGYSGHSLYLMLKKREQLFSQAYSDTRMVGISMGTNDRNLEINRSRLEKRFKRDLIEYVEWFYSKGIQPFILTSQASVEPDTLYESQKLNQLQNKKSEVTHAVINRIKKEVAKEYDLELIDVSKFGELFLTYSEVPATKIINDKLHFNDAGHLAQAGYIFSKIFDRVVEIDEDEILSFTNQRMRSGVAHERTALLDTIENGFKVIVDYTKEDTNDMLILDFWFLNSSKNTFTLKSYINSTQLAYVVLDGNKIQLTDAEQVLANSLDIGLHHVQAYTGETQNVDFKGFKLTKNNVL